MAIVGLSRPARLVLLNTLIRAAFQQPLQRLDASKTLNGTSRKAHQGIVTVQTIRNWQEFQVQHENHQHDSKIRLRKFPT